MSMAVLTLRKHLIQSWLSLQDCDWSAQVKGYSVSSLDGVQVQEGMRAMYERVRYGAWQGKYEHLPQVWDEADYVVPPAENGAFFVTTNVVITPNQTWGECPEVRVKSFWHLDWFENLKIFLKMKILLITANQKNTLT